MAVGLSKQVDVARIHPRATRTATSAIDVAETATTFAYIANYRVDDVNDRAIGTTMNGGGRTRNGSLAVNER